MPKVTNGRTDGPNIIIKRLRYKKFFIRKFHCVVKRSKNGQATKSQIIDIIFQWSLLHWNFVRVQGLNKNLKLREGGRKKG